MNQLSQHWRVVLIATLISTIACIHISTSSLEEVYSGPGGVPSKGWDSMVKPNTYSNYESVAQFLFTETTNEEYYYETVQEAFGPPQITVESGEDVVDPYVFGIAVGGYFFDGRTYWEELPDLNIFFNCQKEGNAILSLTIQTSLMRNDEDPANALNETIKFYFEKDCRSRGNREGFSVGFHNGRMDDVVKHGVVQQHWAVESYYFLDKTPILIGPEEHLSTFHISISNPAYGNQFFYEPTVFVEDDEIIDVQVRGNAATGGVAGSMPESLVLIYDCLFDGDTEISVGISLGYYGTVQFGFTKTCQAPKNESEMPGTINVGASRSAYAGIVANSVTSLLWRASNPAVEIGPDEIATNFYVSTESGRSQEILKPIVTVNPPTAFGVTLSGYVRDGGVVTGSPQHFTLNYICEKVSEASVIVTIKLPNAKTVEFSFLKKCQPLKRHTDHVWTANQLLLTFIFCFVALFVAAYILYKKKNNTNPKRKSRV